MLAKFLNYIKILVSQFSTVSLEITKTFTLRTTISNLKYISRFLQQFVSFYLQDPSLSGIHDTTEAYTGGRGMEAGMDNSCVHP